MNLWDQVLENLRNQLDSDEFRRWFAETSYASDAGDQLTVWVPSQSAARHLAVHYQQAIDAALAEVDRSEVHLRFVATGIGEDEDEHED